MMAVSTAEAYHLNSAGHIEDLKNLLDKVAKSEGLTLGSVEYCADVGPFKVAALIADNGLALDLDVNQSVVNRALRRQHWASLAPDVRIAEISAAAWDVNCGLARSRMLAKHLAGSETA